MNTEVNNIAKFYAVPVGKKFRTIAVMENGEEVVVVKSGAYKKTVNIHNKMCNCRAPYGSIGMYMSFTTPVVKENNWSNEDTYIKSMPVELVA
jgi:tRNA nucleotidyltransferase/poly(A) polymerase